MSDQRKIDFKKHQLPPVSRRYLMRFIIYIILLTTLVFAIKYIYTKQNGSGEPTVDEVENVTIELTD